MGVQGVKKNKPSPILCYSVIISEIIIILFILSLLPNISSSVIKLPIIIIADYTITDHTITDRSYYFSVLIPNVLLPILTITIFFVSRTVLLPIRYITNKSYYRIDYNRFVLLLNISIPEKYHYRMVLLPNWVLPNCFITVCYYRMLHTLSIPY